jgi:hypothetical protein
MQILKNIIYLNMEVIKYNFSQQVKRGAFEEALIKAIR